MYILINESFYVFKNKLNIVYCLKFNSSSQVNVVELRCENIDESVDVSMKM